MASMDEKTAQESDETIELVNGLTGYQFLKYLERKQINCFACSENMWSTYFDGNIKKRNRVQIITGILIRELDAENVLVVGEGLPPPTVAATCLGCGAISSFNATVVADYILKEVDDHG